MDIKIEGGQWAMDENGAVQTVTGMEEQLQRIRMRLSAKRERFYPDPQFGSYLYRLTEDTPNKEKLALTYARQALGTMPQVFVQSARWEGREIIFHLTVQGEEQEVRVDAGAFV
ncbi:MAG: hypothetical protein LIO46_02875 [Clostridiales bacterium]|nr:hypothetical protein [Clostridiales bacterium]